MIRKIALIVCFLFHFGCAGQIDLTGTDSISAFLIEELEKSVLPEDPEDHTCIEFGPEISSLPIPAGCEETEKSKIAACLNTYLKNFISEEANIPESIMDSVFRTQIIVNFSVDTNSI